MKKNKAYWENKIIYALSKIDYAKSRIENRKDLNERSRVYATIKMYGGKAKLEQIIKITKLPKEMILSVLKELKALKILKWEGRISNKKNVAIAKDIKVVFEGIKQGNLTEKITGFGFDKEGNIIHPDDFTETKTPNHTNQNNNHDDYVDVDWKDGVILRIRKDKIKEMVL